MVIINFANNINNDLNMLISNHFIVLLLLIFLSIATYTDIKEQKIYDKFNIIFFITRIVVIFIPIIGFKLIPSHLVGGVVGFIVLLIPAIALMHKMGGDIKFIGVLGFYLGFYVTIALLILSCIYNLIYSIITIFVLKKSKIKTNIPFAPFFLISFITLIIITII